MNLYLSDPEARSFAQGERVLWRESADYIPILSNGFHWEIDDDGLWAVENEPIRFPDDGPEMRPTGVDVPFKPGSPVDLRETWGNGFWELVYKADKNRGWVIGSWHSPVTMPRDAVRWHMTVKSVEVEQRDEKWWWKIEMEVAK